MDATRTRLAILGTMSDLHRQPIRYDLDCLQKVIADVSPDLLCAEIMREEWERGDFSKATLEVREAFAQVVASTDIVLIPVTPTPKQFPDFTPDSGWRRAIVRSLDQILRWGQFQANDLGTVNGKWFGAFCHTVCWLTEMFWTPENRLGWKRQNKQLAENIIRAVQRDPGRRVLVAVQCQRLHDLIQLLRAHEDLFNIVSYRDL
jgi:hypothetical protein